MRSKLPKPTLYLLLLTLLLGIAYGAFELHLSTQSPHDRPVESLIDSSLDLSRSIFSDLHDRFEEESLELKLRIEHRLAETTSRQAIHSELLQFRFWGSTLLRNGELYAWHGFARGLPMGPSSLPDDTLLIRIERHNNVTFLLGTISFRVGDEDRFTLVTSERLEQNHVIPIAREQEFDLARHPSLKNHYPVQFSFFDPLPMPVEFYRTLEIAGVDSAAIVYADISDRERFFDRTEAEFNRWRTLFHLAFFLFGSALFFLWASGSRSWPLLFLQLGLIISIWFLLVRSGVPADWISHFVPGLDGRQQDALQAVSFYAAHAIFAFFTVFCVITQLTRKWNLLSPEKYFQTFFRSSLLAAISLVLILFFLITTLETGRAADIALLDLELIPGPGGSILFISTGFFISSVMALLVASWWVLFVAEKDKTAVIALIASLSFFLFYFLADRFVEEPLFEGWKFLLAFGLFAISIGTGILIHNKPALFLQISGFRFLLLISLLTSVAGYVIFASAEEDRMESRLLETAGQFLVERTGEEDSLASEIAFRLLSSIEQRLIFLSSEDIEERLSSVQARFQRAILTTMREEWRRYSFEIMLLSAEGEVLSDYSTTLDSPGTGYYDLLRMQTSYRQERIRRENNRPVVQGAPGGAGYDDYITFHRGWIPVYDDLNPDRIIAWIVAAVYVERPAFNKPIRAVLAASTEEDWRSSYYLAEFENGMLSRSALRGIYAHQPKYNRLSDWELEIAQSDSIAFISNLTAQGRFRELLLKGEDDRIVKASTPVPGLNQHIFSLFRIQIIILAAGTILFFLLSLLGLKNFRLFGQNRTFRNRLLDGMAAVTLLLLIVLIFSTRTVITHQNKSNLEREIITKLDNMAESILSEQNPTTRETDLIPLTGAASPLGADAIFFRENRVIQSTTPQIFQQNLLPQLLPFPVYDFLYGRQRNHIVQNIEIGGQPLLIGYRMVRNIEHQPLGVIAIPTFLESPIYTEHLLETTSYLLLFYLLVIGGFVAGTVLLANRLTRPLYDIREGLDKISGGNLETTIPVKSSDEIGELSAAYNTMVEKLGEARSELARAEREAAWKEMARQIAHEIKNPLTPIKLNLQHLQRQLDIDPDTPDEMRRQVERVTRNIVEQIESLNRIASDFSTFAHPIRDPFTRFDINELIRTLVDFYSPHRQASIRQELNPTPLPVDGSEDELRRTLINLIKNGMEAGGNGTRLVIRSLRSNGRVVVEVEDNGSGIPEELREKIFTPNFSTKSSGTGLGLAIAKKIVEAHNGTISFREAPGNGTIFRIELPPATGKGK